MTGQWRHWSVGYIAVDQGNRALEGSQNLSGTTGAADDKPIGVLFMGQSEPLKMGLILYYGVLFTGQAEVGNWILSYGFIDVLLQDK